MNAWELGKLRVAMEVAAGEAASTVGALGHENPKSVKAVGKASGASLTYRNALLGR